jgi:hypothetical protein
LEFSTLWKPRAYTLPSKGRGKKGGGEARHVEKSKKKKNNNKIKKNLGLRSTLYALSLSIASSMVVAAAVRYYTPPLPLLLLLLLSALLSLGASQLV